MFRGADRVRLMPVPLTKTPTAAPTLVDVTLFDRTREVPVIELTVVPAGMPAPVTLIATAIPDTLERPSIVADPEVRLAVGVTAKTAAALITSVAEVTLTPVVPAGIPKPEIVCPAIIPVFEERPVKVVEPADALAVGL